MSLANPLKVGFFHIFIIGIIVRFTNLKVERLDYMRTNGDTYMPIVISNERDRIVACGTLMMERKFIHNCGTLGHIEDIVVSDKERGKGLGKLLIEQLKYLALELGAYKITLDCDRKNEEFYAKSNFVTKGLQMVIYAKDQ